MAAASDMRDQIRLILQSGNQTLLTHAKTVNPAVHSDPQYVLDLTVYFLEPQHYCKQRNRSKTTISFKINAVSANVTGSHFNVTKN